jgi:membrane protease YdiL (CAAX protease family)
MQRPLLRVALFLGANYLIMLLAAIPKGMVPRAVADLTWGTIASLGLWGLSHLVLRREGRTPRDIGLGLDRGSAARLAIGFAAGIALYALTVAIVSVAVGPVRLVPTDGAAPGTVALTVASFLALSAMEELGFRGYALRSALPALGPWGAQLVIALLFGAGHWATGWPALTVLNGVIPSALLFGVLAARTGGLAAPIGLHAALNVAYWAVGAKETPGLWTLDVDPDRIAAVQGAAPWLGTAITLLAAALVAAWPRREGAVPTAPATTSP